MKAIAYYRTSSLVNVTKAPSDKEKDEELKHSMLRQRDAVTRYANFNNLTIEAEYYDAAVSGADTLNDRHEFTRMLADMERIDAPRIILIENVSRFARDLTVQLVGHELLKSRGITLIPVDAPDLFQNETPTAELIRNILACISMFEKKSTVARLRAARDHKRKTNGRCEGRKLPSSECIAAARALRAQGHTLRSIGPLMAELGFINEGDKRIYSHESVRRMVRA